MARRPKWTSCSKALSQAVVERERLRSTMKEGEVLGGLGALPSSSPTVGEYVETFLTELEAKEGKVRPHTLRRYRHELTHYAVPYLGTRRMSQLTRKDITAWNDWLGRLEKEDGERYCKLTVDGVWRTVKQLFARALAQEVVSADPTVGHRFENLGGEPRATAPFRLIGSRT